MSSTRCAAGGGNSLHRPCRCRDTRCRRQPAPERVYLALQHRPPRGGLLIAAGRRGAGLGRAGDSAPVQPVDRPGRRTGGLPPAHRRRHRGAWRAPDGRRDADLHAKPAARVRPGLRIEVDAGLGGQRRQRHGGRLQQQLRHGAAAAHPRHYASRRRPGRQPLHRLRHPVQRADRPRHGDGQHPDDAAALTHTGLHLFRDL